MNEASKHVTLTGKMNNKNRQIYIGSRGGMYVLGSTGRPIYKFHLPGERPARKMRSNKGVKKGPRNWQWAHTMNNTVFLH